MPKIKDEFIVLHNPSNFPYRKWELYHKGEQTFVSGESSGSPTIQSKVVTKIIGKYHSEEMAVSMKSYYESLNKFKQVQTSFKGE